MPREEVFYLRCWSFTSPEGKTVNIEATFEISEDEARRRLADKGRDVTGWKAKLEDKPVKVATVVVAEGSGKWRVTVRATAYATADFEVEAEDEDAAGELALEEAEDYCDWDFDADDFEVDEVQEIG